ncbi:MAG: hypothetical protein COA65_08415 [Rhodospirillaceae bacterium]|nr:MAG: hypothetical protein COA65_08415 [Rhodospirillaceae bacterium]
MQPRADVLDRETEEEQAAARESIGECMLCANIFSIHNGRAVSSGGLILQRVATIFAWPDFGMVTPTGNLTSI